nr:unnamed protein product [Spirometra erinaceieuropaei]
MDHNEPPSGVLVDSEAYHQDSGENKPRKHQKGKKEHGLGISQSPHHHHPHHHPHHQHHQKKKKGQKYWFQFRLKKTGKCSLRQRVRSLTGMVTCVDVNYA